MPTTETSVISVLIKRVDTIRLKFSTKSLSNSKIVYILALHWENSRQEKCKILFAFQDKTNFTIHQNILHMFVATLTAFQSSQLQSIENQKAKNEEKASKIAHNRSYQLAVRDCDVDDDDYKCDSNDRSDKEYRTVVRRQDNKQIEKVRLVRRQGLTNGGRSILRRRPVVRDEPWVCEMPSVDVEDDRHRSNQHQQWSLKQFLFKCITPTKCETEIRPHAYNID